MPTRSRSHPFTPSPQLMLLIPRPNQRRDMQDRQSLPSSLHLWLWPQAQVQAWSKTTWRRIQKTKTKTDSKQTTSLHSNSPHRKNFSSHPPPRWQNQTAHKQQQPGHTSSRCSTRPPPNPQWDRQRTYIDQSWPEQGEELHLFEACWTGVWSWAQGKGTLMDNQSRDTPSTWKWSIVAKLWPHTS